MLMRYLNIDSRNNHMIRVEGAALRVLGAIVNCERLIKHRKRRQMFCVCDIIENRFAIQVHRSRCARVQIPW